MYAGRAWGCSRRTGSGAGGYNEHVHGDAGLERAANRRLASLAMPDLPIVCTLSAADRSGRREDLLPGLLGTASEATETEWGFRFRFDSSSGTTLARIAAVLDRERQCCRFFRFALTVPQDLGPVWLEVSGPEGTKAFLADLAA